jgi:cation transport ATPase
MPAWQSPFLSCLLFPAAGTADNTEGTAASCSTSVVVLDVGGMKCGGCSAAVKRMLLQRPDVESAAVNLLTETAAIKFRCVAVTSRGGPSVQQERLVSPQNLQLLQVCPGAASGITSQVPAAWVAA